MVLSDEFELGATRHTPFDYDSPYVFGKSGANKFTTVGSHWYSLPQNAQLDTRDTLRAYLLVVPGGSFGPLDTGDPKKSTLYYPENALAGAKRFPLLRRNPTEPQPNPAH